MRTGFMPAITALFINWFASRSWQAKYGLAIFFQIVSVDLYL